MQQGKIVITEPNQKQQQHVFNFDQSFDINANQELVFQSALVPMLEYAIMGNTSCFLTYGQTNAGKTYTNFGQMPSVYGMAQMSVD